MAITKVTWDVDSDGDWSDASDWSTGTLPDSADSVTISTTDVHTITYSVGSTTVDALTVGAKDNFIMSGGALDVLTTASFADGFTQAGGTLSANAVTITGTGTLTGGEATGATAFTISGTIALANYTLAGASVLNNAATTDQTGQITVGDDTGVGAGISNASTGNYVIGGDFGITGGAASASFVNLGELQKSAGSGTSDVGIDLTSSGTLDAVSGNLEFSGPTNAITGVLGGNGEISFGGGVTTLDVSSATVAALGIYNTATVNLGGNLSYSGNLDDISDGSNTFNLGGNTLDLGKHSSSSIEGNYGIATVTGSGTFDNAGTLSLANAVFGGTVALKNSGTILQAGTVTFGDGSGNAPSIHNTGTYNFTSDTGIGENDATSVFVNSGTIEKTASSGTSDIALAVSNSGTIDSESGTLTFDGTLDNSGTIGGTSAVAIVNAGVATLSAGTVLSVSNFDLYDTATLNVKASVTYAGIFSDVSDGSNIINLAGTTLTLTGATNSILGTYGDAYIGGTGEIANAGTLTLGDSVVEGTAEIDNTSTVNQTANVQIGGADGRTASIVNAQSATYNVTAAVQIDNGVSAASHFDNSGTFNVTAGIGAATIATVFNNLSTGTINVATGSLDNAGILINHGTIAGTDFAIVNSGEVTLAAGTALQVAEFDMYSTSQLTLDESYTYNGIFNDASDGTTVINLGTHELRLTGAADFDSSYGPDIITGSGTLDIAHSANFAGQTTEIGGTTTLEIGAFITASGGLQVGDGSGDAASAVINSGRTYDIVTDAGADISRGTSSASVLTNNGTFEKTAGTGTTVVSVDFVNNGTINVTSGTIEFLAGTLTNNGTIDGTITTDSSGDIFVSAPAPGDARPAAASTASDSFDFSTTTHSHTVGASLDYLSLESWLETPASTATLAGSVEHSLPAAEFGHGLAAEYLFHTSDWLQ
jgi:hypothetical protein